MLAAVLALADADSDAAKKLGLYGVWPRDCGKLDLAPTWVFAETDTDAERLVAAQRPELAVIDVNLKGEKAYDLINRLCDEGVPVVVVSGYAGLPRLTDRAVVILPKPFNAPDLIAGLRQAVSGVAAHKPH